MANKYTPAYTVKYAHIKNIISIILAIKNGANSLYKIKLMTSINGLRLSEVFDICIEKNFVVVQGNTVKLAPLGQDLFERWNELCDMYEKRSKLDMMLNPI